MSPDTSAIANQWALVLPASQQAASYFWKSPKEWTTVTMWLRLCSNPLVPAVPCPCSLPIKPLDASHCYGLSQDQTPVTVQGCSLLIIPSSYSQRHQTWVQFCTGLWEHTLCSWTPLFISIATLQACLHPSCTGDTSSPQAPVGK